MVEGVGRVGAGRAVGLDRGPAGRPALTRRRGHSASPLAEPPGCDKLHPSTRSQTASLEGEVPIQSPQHPSMWAEEQLLGACVVRRQRRSGPGGQHRNKVETGILMTHRDSGLAVSATERRSQDANLRQAIQRLRIRLAIEYRTPAERPSLRWKQRAATGRLLVSRDHRDYPAILAELLNHLAEHGWNDAAAAEALGCTRSSIMRTLRREPAALAMVNRQRAALGMTSLH